MSERKIGAFEQAATAVWSLLDDLESHITNQDHNAAAETLAAAKKAVVALAEKAKAAGS